MTQGQGGAWEQCTDSNNHSDAYSFAPVSSGPVHKPLGHDVECLGSAASDLWFSVSVLLEKTPTQGSEFLTYVPVCLGQQAM